MCAAREDALRGRAGGEALRAHQHRLEASLAPVGLGSRDLLADLGTNIVSTIAVAVSPCSCFVASSHGDHTVKVFALHSNKLHRNLRGHPRTPWTVRYHPTDSNIVASGCLGGQVRVWNVARGSTTVMFTAGATIHSLAFHPFDPLLAVVCGCEVRLWDWQAAADHSANNSNNSSSIISESRNTT